ncbi:MAG TPA: response regulator [Anaerolineales bacterium]|nr:response regulator [Anaerolineales bacterium]
MHQPITILYVEDSPENRLLVRRVLQAEGYTVLEAAGADQAVQVLQTHLPDLILMDINMPGVDGYTLTARLKSQAALKHVPIIALTANVRRGDWERSIQAGCDGYIQKPFDVDDLPIQVQGYLQAARKFPTGGLTSLTDFEAS